MMRLVGNEHSTSQLIKSHFQHRSTLKALRREERSNDEADKFIALRRQRVKKNMSEYLRCLL